MKRVRNFMFASAGFLMIVVTVAVATGERTIAQITAGCIKICDEVPVRVALTNIARIAGDVRITNDSDTPIPTRLNGAVLVDSSAQNAVRTRSGLQVTDVFQREVVITLEPGQVTETASFNVPQSRLLAIESASGFAQMGAPTQAPVVLVKTIANGDYAGRIFMAQFSSGGWILSPVSWGSPLLYADPGSKVELKFSRVGTVVGTATATVTLSGHFIDQ